MEATVDPCPGGPDWMPITPKTGSLFHAETHYYLPGDLEACIGRFVEYYNNQRYHESLKNLTPADVYFGRGQTILLKRERIKRDTIKNRRLQHQKKAA